MRKLHRSLLHVSAASVIALAAISWDAPILRGLGAHVREGRPPPAAPAPPQRATTRLAASPLHFEPRPASDGLSRFEAIGLDYGLTLSASGVRLHLPDPDGSPALLTLTVDGGAAHARLDGEDPLAGVVHRYVGAREHWQRDIPTFGRVTAHDVRPGIDVTYYGTRGELEYDFVIAPGARPADASMIVGGADRVGLDDNGDLVLGVGSRSLRQHRPQAWQDRDGQRVAVEARFTWDAAASRLGFEIGSYDPALPLVIDPVLVYSSWFGGIGAEEYVDIALDANGFIYVLGFASAGGYPTTPGSFQPSKPGPANTTDYVVTKFNPAGTAVIYSTYLGGTADDYSSSFNLPGALAVDALGQVHIAGETRSTDFPVTAGAAQGTFGGSTFDAVYARLSADGSLGYATYIGGSDTEQAFGVAVDAAGAAYVLGGTNSSVAESFPVTGNAYAPTLNGLRDVFVARFSSAGALTYCSYFGGSSSEAFTSGDIVVDGANRVVFGSDTSSSNLPVTGTARQATYGGGSSEGFLARLDTSVTGTAGLLYSTYIGGSSSEAVYGVARDASGQIYVAGQTGSANFPVTAGAYDTTFNPGGFALDAFVAKYDVTLSGAASQIYSTLIGGSDRESLFDIAVDTQGRAHVVGQSRATDFPLVQPVDSQFFIFEAIVSILDPTGSALVFSSYLTPAANGAALTAIAVNAAGETYVVGTTNGSTPQSATQPNGFPVINAIQPIYGGGGKDAVLQKLGFSVDLSLTKTASAAVVLPGQPVTFTLTVTNPSSDPASGVVVTDTLPVGLQFVSCSATQSGICGGSGNARTVTFASLAPATSATIQIVATMVAVTPGQQILNSAAVVAGVLDPVPANNIGTATVSVPTLEPSGDADGDGLSNGFESTYGLDPFGGAGSGSADDPDGDGKTNLQEQQEGTHPRGFVITYLAEGATGAFFDTRLAIANPTAAPALVLTRFQRADGVTIRDYRVVAPMSRATIDVETLAGLESAEFSTLVEADVQVVADRTMSWDSTGYGSHAERGILTRTATKWYFAEGATFGPFNLFYLVQNPNAQDAQVTVTYLLGSGAPLTKTYTVRAQSRFNIWVDNEGATDPALARLASAELSAIIESTNGVPIIAERAMYLDQPGRALGAGHESAGVTAPATQWFLAEGATGDYFDLFILIANPQATPAAVQAEYLLTTGQVITRTYTVPGNSRFNIWVDQEPGLANAALSTRITATNGVPIIVERAMWWPGPTSDTWQEAHNSPGETTTGTRWAMAEGEVGGPRDTDTYVLIANTSSFAGTIRATVLFEDGTAPVTRTYPIAASSRFNIAPAADEFFPETRGKRFGMLVESIGGTPAQIVVERAMYSDAGGVNWAAGTNALATKLP